MAWTWPCVGAAVASREFNGGARGWRSQFLCLDCEFARLMAFRSNSVTGKGIVYSRRRGGGFSGRSLASRGKPSVIFEESEESDHALQPPSLRTRPQSQQNDDVNANRISHLRLS